MSITNYFLKVNRIIQSFQAEVWDFSIKLLQKISVFELNYRSVFHRSWDVDEHQFIYDFLLNESVVDCLAHSTLVSLQRMGRGSISVKLWSFLALNSSTHVRFNVQIIKNEISFSALLIIMLFYEVWVHSNKSWLRALFLVV